MVGDKFGNRGRNNLFAMITIKKKIYFSVLFFTFFAGRDNACGVKITLVLKNKLFLINNYFARSAL